MITDLKCKYNKLKQGSLLNWLLSGIWGNLMTDYFNFHLRGRRKEIGLEYSLKKKKQFSVMLSEKVVWWHLVILWLPNVSVVVSVQESLGMKCSIVFFFHLSHGKYLTEVDILRYYFCQLKKHHALTGTWKLGQLPGVNCPHCSIFYFFLEQLYRDVIETWTINI